MTKLTAPEIRDIKLWFGWGAILGYPTDPRSYLRQAMKHKALLLDMPRDKRKAVLQFVCEEYERRRFKMPWEK